MIKTYIPHTSMRIECSKFLSPSFTRNLYFFHNFSIRFLIVVISTGGAFISCKQNSFNSADELWEYVKDSNNGFEQTKVISNVEFKLLYKPTDLMVVQDLDANSTDSMIRSLRNQYSRYLYFTLSMNQNGSELINSIGQHQQKRGAISNTLSFEMEQNIFLCTSEKDTVPLIDYIYPRMYGSSGETSILFVYPRRDVDLKQKNLNFIIKDLGFYTGEVKFRISCDKVRNEPIITF